VRGVDANIDIPVNEALQHLDMIFALRAEAQKGPFGIYGEIIYIGLSDVAEVPGLINNIHEQVDLTLVDTALSWRLVNQPRWSLDFAAGTHYSNVYERLTLNGDRAAIFQASEQFVANIGDPTSPSRKIQPVFVPVAKCTSARPLLYDCGHDLDALKI